MGEQYDRLKQRLREIATLESIEALLAWDQETMMPRGAGRFRAEEIALTSRLAHERRVDPRIGELLDACEADPALTADPLEAANLREIRRDYERDRELPAALVAEIRETGSRAVQVWKAAREKSDFAAFAPWLRKQVELARRKAECHGRPAGGELYDQLLEDFEPGMTAARLETIFEPLRRALVPLIAAAPTPRKRLDGIRVPVPAQHEFNVRVAERLGYDLGGGRLDVSTHPFTNGLGPGDTRITTRYAEADFTDALSSTMHEVGHALYEQGLPKEQRHGQPLGQVAGLGIHESQSRLWENQVGRSRAFWEWALPEARNAFGSALDGVTVDEVHAAVNAVQPGLIRVESDETTYNMHIMLRFDLERALIRGDLDVDDVPGAWNERIRQDLGLDVPDDRRGCLQDIHWAMGGIGYFPTYTLGNLYSAQLWQALSSDLPDLDRQISRGEFGALLGWLREKIHVHARRYPAPELCHRVTGRPLEHAPLIRHLAAKQGASP